jgi:NAD+ diphosphatase
MAVRNYYADGGLDRAAERRQDADWITARLRDEKSRFYPIWRLRSAITDDEPPRSLALTPNVVAEHGLAEKAILLGLRDGVAHFALDLSALEALDGLGLDESTFHDLRDFGLTMGREEAALLAYARGLVHWHRGHRFCGICGHPTRIERTGHMRRCQNADCGRMHFPRMDPAVITLVTDGSRCLLARRGVWPENRRSTIAGFVEPGEMLEDAVRRETLEEVGVEVGDAVYHSSQPWPFPASLMLGFTAKALSTDIQVDGEEIVAADWYTRDEIHTQVASGQLILPPPDSISSRLVSDWIERGE